MPFKYGKSMRHGGKKISLNQRFFVVVFNKTVIPPALLRYEMIIANSPLHASLSIYHPISNARSWNNC